MNAPEIASFSNQNKVKLYELDQATSSTTDCVERLIDNSVTLFFPAILFCLILICGAQDRHNHGASSDTINELASHRSGHNQDNGHSRRSHRKGRIEASIVPVVNPNGPEDGRSSNKLPKAEVRVLIRNGPKPPAPHTRGLIHTFSDPHASGLIRASSILMDYDEDIRKYFNPDAKPEDPPQHRIRHPSHKQVAPTPLLDDYFAVNEAQLDQADSSSEISSEEEDSTDSPRRVIVRVNAFSSAPRKYHRVSAHGNVVPKVIDSGRTFKPLRPDSYAVLHSPMQIYIPVRYPGGEGDPSEIPSDCLLCSQNISLTALRGETQVEVPVPAISICHRSGALWDTSHNDNLNNWEVQDEISWSTGFAHVLSFDM
ncbi:uncharacterized protein CEXT_100411 [Caerostris extrusa]|uniref:Uncharacterized protein n=1 Tax=Caerostris extrusa TaxID=172846 RepID=A0AAV4NBN3_CAEEX|nr:uncharacterized protein CEXT_100411 [Caerostris extrusa]